MIQNCGFVTNKIHDLPDTAFRSNDKQKSRRDAAETVEPLDETEDRLREEIVKELE